MIKTKIESDIDIFFWSAHEARDGVYELERRLAKVDWKAFADEMQAFDESLPTGRERFLIRPELPKSTEDTITLVHAYAFAIEHWDEVIAGYKRMIADRVEKIKAWPIGPAIMKEFMVIKKVHRDHQEVEAAHIARDQIPTVRLWHLNVLAASKLFDDVCVPDVGPKRTPKLKVSDDLLTPVAMH